jgi:hypothetical protein
MTKKKSQKRGFIIDFPFWHSEIQLIFLKITKKNWMFPKNPFTSLFAFLNKAVSHSNKIEVHNWVRALAGIKTYFGL